MDVRLKNEGDRPVVVQSWLDTGQANETPDAIKVPFVLMPPMARLEAGHSQVVRMVFTGEALPQDKESVFWLNVLEIPPKEKLEEGRNSLQFALRSRIKVFYRPTAIVGKADEAPAKLGWKVTAADGGYVLEATNPTAYHVNLNQVKLRVGGASIDAGDGMVAPGSVRRFGLKGLKEAPASADIEYSFIDDFGAIRDGDTTKLQ